MTSYQQRVTDELAEMFKLGMIKHAVFQAAVAEVKSDPEVYSDNSCMKTSEAASLAIEVVGVR